MCSDLAPAEPGGGAGFSGALGDAPVRKTQFVFWRSQPLRGFPAFPPQLPGKLLWKAKSESFVSRVSHRSYLGRRRIVGINVRASRQWLRGERQFVACNLAESGGTGALVSCVAAPGGIPLAMGYGIKKRCGPTHQLNRRLQLIDAGGPRNHPKAGGGTGNPWGLVLSPLDMPCASRQGTPLLQCRVANVIW